MALIFQRIYSCKIFVINIFVIYILYIISLMQFSTICRCINSSLIINNILLLVYQLNLSIRERWLIVLNLFETCIYDWNAFFFKLLYIFIKMQNFKNVYNNDNLITTCSNDLAMIVGFEYVYKKNKKIFNARFHICVICTLPLT